MQFWITIENSAGIVYNPGEIMTARFWEHAPAMDRAGTFAFEAPMLDDHTAPIEGKRYAHCWAYINNVLTDMGCGIIDVIEKTVSDGVDMIRVSGSDLLIELSNTSVGDLELNTDITEFPSEMSYVEIGDPIVEVSLPNLLDGTGSTETFDLGYDADRLVWLYIDSLKEFYKLHLYISTPNVNACTIALCQYYTSGQGWVGVTGLSDGTNAGGKTFVTDGGIISWDQPQGWELFTTGAGQRYRIRIAVTDSGGGTGTSEMVWVNAYISRKSPCTTALAEIIALDANWSLDVAGESATSVGVNYTFHGESILAALVKLTEMCPGDHFILASTSVDARIIKWIHSPASFSGWTASGVRAISGGDLADQASETGLCQIESYKESQDSYDLVTRVSPYGAGIGSAAVTLAQATDAAPAGYTLNTGSNYLARDDIEASLGYSIHKRVDFKFVVPRDTGSTAMADAANKLLEITHTYLQRWGQFVQQIELAVTDLKQVLTLLTTIRVDIWRVRNGYKGLDINADMLILSATTRIDERGVWTNRLTVSNADAWLMTDAEKLIKKYETLLALSSQPQQVQASDLRTDYMDGGLVIATSSNGAVAKPINEVSGLSGSGNYILKSGDTATGTIAFAATVAQGNAFITSINAGNSTIDWANVSKLLSSLADLATRNHSDLSVDANQHIDHTAVTLTAGNGLTGGGTIAASRSFAVQAADTSIGVAAGGISVALNATASGLQVSSGLMLADSVAGNGLTIASKVLAVGAGTLITVAADSVGLSNGSAQYQVPLTGAGAFTPAWATASADVSGGGVAILRSDTNGYLKLARLGVGVAPSVPLHALAAGEQLRLTNNGAVQASFTVDANGYLSIAPSGNILSLPSAVRIQSANYASQLTGWGVTYAGSGDWRYGYFDELHAKAFIADLEQALAGGQIICKSVAELASDFTCPAAGAATNGSTYPHLRVKDLPSATGMQVFQAGDIVRLRSFSRAAGSLDISNAWGVVSSPVDNEDGTQSWTFTRSAAPNAGSLATDAVVSAKTLVLDYGTTGNGFYEVNAIDGLYAVNSPYAQTVTWSGHPATGLTLRTRMGNLYGITAATEYGLYAGDGAVAATNKFLRMSDTVMEIHNVPIRIEDGTAVRIRLEPVEQYISVGPSAPTSYLGADGFWVGDDSGTYKAHLGTTNSGALVKGLSWDGSVLNVKGAIVVGNGSGFITPSLLHLPFDGPLPYETDFQVNTNGHLGQTATVTGGVIGRPGKFGKGAQIAEATINVLADASFEHTSITGYWTVDVGGGTGTAVLDTAHVYFHSQAAKLTKGSSYLNVYQSITTSAASYTISAFVYTDGSAVTASDFRFIIDGNQSTPTFVSVGNGWYYAYKTVSETAAAHATGISAIGAKTVWVDGVQFEQKAVPTPFAYFSFPGHSGAISTTNTRAVGALSYSSGNVNPEHGTIMFWWSPRGNGAAPMLFDLRNGGNTNAQSLYYQSPTLRWASNGADRITHAMTPAIGQQYHIAVTYDYTNDSYGLYVDGVQVGASGTALTQPSLGSAFILGALYSGTGYEANGVFSDVAILDHVLTADEVSVIYQSNLPLVVPTNKFELMLTGSGKGVVYGHAGGLFGKDASGLPSFALVNEDGLSWNGETLNSGDAMFGNNTASKANMFWDASTGRVNFRGGTTTEAYIDTTGAITGGGGNSVIDSSGFAQKLSTAWSSTLSYRILNSAGTYLGGLGGYADSPHTQHTVSLRAINVTGKHSSVSLSATADADKTVQAYMGIYHDGVDEEGSLVIWADNGTLPKSQMVGVDSFTMIQGGSTVFEIVSGGPVGIATAVAANTALTIKGNHTDGSHQILIGYGSDDAQKAIIRTSGSFESATNSYGAISDVSRKHGIVDATPKLADLLKVRIRNFVMNDDASELKQIGVVAQELEKIFPSLVYEVDENGTKAIKYSVFVPMLIKAVQEFTAEARERLDRLEQKVA